ncbi:hypothetical protein D9756_010320 [Leucocoprinus leucothites]|uniref:Uncharacterized protein n=1 Tax=Leucocoprinus leucothites TaxID=201217 RepID=A0A8H5FT40_9AGAR|nr:hypothetical protein D9756_010320 [Leucoagaricus leucothites]
MDSESVPPTMSSATYHDAYNFTVPSPDNTMEESEEVIVVQVIPPSPQLTATFTAPNKTSGNDLASHMSILSISPQSITSDVTGWDSTNTGFQHSDSTGGSVSQSR